MNKQLESKNSIDRRARFVKKINKEKMNTELKKRSMQRASKAPRMIGKLVALNKWKKLVIHVTDKTTMNELYNIDDTYNTKIENCKSPVYANEDEEGLYLKVGVPQFMHGDLFNVNSMVGSNIKFVFHSKSYSSTSDFGNGYYFTLAAMPVLDIDDSVEE